MNNEDIIFVLCNPEDSRNIGACCRAMKTMKLQNLHIVGEKQHYDENQVHTLALEAFDLWQNASFFSSLSDAVAACTIAAGTTRRFGKKRMGKLLLPQEFVDLATSQNGAKIAVVFGNERTGLTDKELDCCTIGVTIPSNSEFGSLNLSHAMQIIAWEFFKKTVTEDKKTERATITQIDNTVVKMMDNIVDMGFFKITGRQDMKRFWKNIFSRAAVTSKEIIFIEKFFNKLKALSKKKYN